MTSYLDFDIRIEEGIGRDFPVIVNSPAGDARGAMRFPLDELVLENRLLTLQTVLLRSGGKRRQALTDEERSVQEFGRDLFDALLVDDLRSLFYESRALADRQEVGLRIRLRFAVPSLAALPWEFIFDPRYTTYVCLSANTPVVRYLDLPQPPRSLTVTPPLRILAMMASPQDLPGDLPTLDLERERARLERATSQLQSEGLLEVEWLAGQTWRDLQRAMRRGPWHIFHFAGHGGFDPHTDQGFVLLADDQGAAQALRATELGRLLRDHRPLRLAILNACEGGRGSRRDIFSSTASILVRAGLPAVVAMQYEITDRAAIELSRAFYESLADGYPVDAALAEARKAVSLAVNNTMEWGTPVLFMRAPDGVLFDLAAPAEAVVGEASVAEAPLDPWGQAADLPQAAEAISPGTAVEGEALTLEQPKPAVAATVAEEEPAAPSVEAPVPGAVRLEPAVDTVEEPAPAAPARDSRRRSLRGGWLLLAGVAIVAVVAAAIVFGPRIFGPRAAPAANSSPALEQEEPEPGESVITVTGDTARLSGPVDMALVRIPAGEFLMGSDPARDSLADTDEQPQHVLALPEYYIGKFEITNEQYASFMQAAGHPAPDHWEGDTMPAGKEEHPVVGLSWHDATAFTEWLSEQTGQDFRLCTEAEWEKACRETTGRVYPWGDTFDATAANGANPDGTTTPVGAYSPAGDSPYGVADLAGNVLEWTSSQQAPYPYDSTDGREDLQAPDDVHRVLRGGAFFNDALNLRCAFRDGFSAAYKYDFFGFRACVSLPVSVIGGHLPPGAPFDSGNLN